MVLSSTWSQGQTVVEPRCVVLAVPGKFNDVIFWGQTNLYGVKIVVGGQHTTKPLKYPDADALGMQMWLLQPDGTSIPQLAKPATGWSGRWDYVDTSLIFTFTRSSTNKVAGIVVRYRGKLYCKEIDTGK